MNVSAMPPPVSSAPTSSMVGSPPHLGSSVPGTTGGLPATPGISAKANPMAKQLQSMGRGQDSMLVHMTPEEVNSLQGLAMAAGGSLTVNPQTGLPEAGWLGKLLPTILGIAGAAFGLPTWAIGLGVGAGQTALTGDLSKGLMAGLQAFGGAGLGNAAGLGGEISKNAFGLVGEKAATTGLPTAAQATGDVLKSVDMSSLGSAAAQPTAAAASAAPQGFLGKFAQETAIPGLGGIGKTLGPAMAGSAMLTGVSEAFQPKVPKLGDEEEGGWNYEGPYVPERRDVSFQSGQQMRDTGGAEYQYFTPSNPVPGYRPTSSLGSDEREEYGFAEGGLAQIPVDDFQQLTQFFGAGRPGAITASPYPPMRSQQASPAPASPGSAPPIMGGGEKTYTFTNPAGGGTGFARRGFAPTMLDISNYYRGGIQIPTPTDYSRKNPNKIIKKQRMAYADGGSVNMKDGAFVVDARTVSELGNGSSNAGMEFLSKMGGRPLHGPGDGVSDSIPAKIGGKQEARVARDEVIFPPEAVRRIGKGSEQRGTAKLYSLMDKAHKARKTAGRGEDTGLRKGLA